jgi:23S rRNA pseudouridine1911/1915/1917 synthase
VELTVTSAEAGKRLDHYLREQLPEYSRARLQEWIKSERVLVNGAPVKASYTLRGGEVVALDILHEDDDLIAVNKPAGMGQRAATPVHTPVATRRPPAEGGLLVD